MARIAAVLLLVLFCGGLFLYTLRSDPTSVPEAPSSIAEDDSAAELAEKSQLIARLEEELRLAREREARLRARLAVEKPEPGKTSSSLIENIRQPTPSGMLKRVEDANRLAEELLERGDLEGLWLLGADLLAFGEEGYEKLIELIAWLENRMGDSPLLRRMMSAEELYIGSFLRAVADNNENLLRFGLYTKNKDPQTLPGPIQELRKEMVDDVGVLLLGFYQGEDPEIYQGYVDWIREETSRGGNNIDDEAIFMLAQIPTESSTDLLIDLLGRTSPRRLIDVIRAMVFQGNERALGALRDLRDRTTDDEVRGLIDAGLRMLE